MLDNRSVIYRLQILNQVSRDPENVDVTLSTNLGPVFSTSYPLNKLSDKKLSLLKSYGVEVPEYHLNIRKLMILQLDLPEEFITAILINWLLAERLMDYREEKVANIQRSMIPVCEFVEAFGHDHLFLVVDCDMTDCSLICIEVDPVEPKAFNLCVLNVKQVQVKDWGGRDNSIRENSLLKMIEKAAE
jgi:hypothetical protein